MHTRRAAAAELKGFKISHTVEKHGIFVRRWKDHQPQPPKLSHEASHITTHNSREKTTQRRKEKNFLIFFLHLHRLLFVELVVCHSTELKRWWMEMPSSEKKKENKKVLHRFHLLPSCCSAAVRSNPRIHK